MIHSCSYYCHKPECIKAQRDELRDKLYKREWVGLTDKDTDVSHLAYSGRSTDYIDGYAAGMEAAEDKLKEKNT